MYFIPDINKVRYIYLIHILTLVVPRYAVAYEIATEVITGAVFEEIPEVVVYEKSIPIWYTTPVIHGINMRATSGRGHLDCGKTESTFGETVLKAMEQINEEITKGHRAQRIDLLGVTHRRQKRGLQLMGDFLHWCCNAITNKEVRPIYRNQEILNNNYESLQNSVIENHMELINITKNVDYLATNIQHRFGELHSYLEKMIETQMQSDREDKQNIAELQALLMDFVTIIQNHLTTEYYQDIISHCKNHQLPPIVVSKEILRKDLLGLQENVRQQGYELAIPVEKILSYYSTRIVQCHQSEFDLQFELKIPLKTLDSQWILYSYVPVHFKYNNEICLIHTDNMYIAANKNEVKSVAGNDLKTCDISSGLCYLDTFEDSLDESPLCAKALFQKQTLDELNQKCNFRCEPLHNRTIIKKISQSVYLLTNVPEGLYLQSTINKQEKVKLSYTSTAPGAIKLKVPCNMEVRKDEPSGQSVVLIPLEFPCGKNTGLIHELQRIIPLQWAKLANVRITSHTGSNMMFPQLSTILNNDWKEVTPSFSIKTNQRTFEDRLKKAKLDIMSSNLDSSDFIWNILSLTWLIVLTMVGIGLSVVLWKVYFELSLLKQRYFPLDTNEPVYGKIRKITKRSKPEEEIELSRR